MSEVKDIINNQAGNVKMQLLCTLKAVSSPPGPFWAKLFDQPASVSVDVLILV